MADTSPEGFSVSSEGLPESAIDAWHATVLIEGRGLVWRPGERPRLRTRRGSGFVVKLISDNRVAVIATNAHIVTCSRGDCDVRVRFGDSSVPENPKWSDAVHIVSREPAKDLALIEVEIPHGAEIRAARFAVPECSRVGVEPVMSIGWPDLRVRKKWGVSPPPNYRAQVKRYSEGLFLLWLDRYRMKSEIGLDLERLQVVFHNADILPGSSGGPLTNRNGEVVGINTMILRDVASSDNHRFCARLDPQKPGACVHVAISSRELIKAFEQAYSSPITPVDCTLTSERPETRR
jgi:S1-C subfamily serine protease